MIPGEALLRAGLEDLEALARETGSERGHVRYVPGPVATITLDHPSARHALSAKMMAELGRAALDAALRGSVGMILTSATSVAFCAGGDLDEVQRHLMRPDAAGRMTRGMSATLDAWAELPVFSVAALRGPAIGGGLELALAADAVIASPNAWVEARQARLGVAAGWGGAPRLVARAGASAALRVLALAERLDADAALVAGLVDRVVEDPLAEAEAWMTQLARIGAEGVAAVKAQVRAATAGRGREAQAEAFLGVWGGETHRARLAAARGRG